MHYRNGREAKNGDQIAQIGEGGKITVVGELRGAVPGNDYCNGDIYVLDGAAAVKASYACLCDCLHVDDVAGLLNAAGVDKRPPGK